MSGEGPLSRRAFAVLIALYLVLRLALLFDPGYVYDVQQYKRWAIGAALGGLPAAYESADVDYPPLFLYPLWVVGRTWLAFQPASAADEVRDSPWFTALIKTPHLVFDLLLAGLLAWLVARGGSWGAPRASPGHGRLAALVYLANPAVLWDSAHWGQPDGGHSFLALGALALVGGGRHVAAGVALAAAGLMKPLAAPLVPLVVLATLGRRGAVGVARLAAGMLGAGLVIFLPFLVTGRLVPVVRRIFSDVEAMPLTSVKAHNLWWILGGWRPANAPLLGPLTPKHIGLALFAAAVLLLLARCWPWLSGPLGAASEERARLLLVGAAIVSSFFFLSTHMHEHHLFLALPLLIGVAGRSRGLAWLAAGTSLAILGNVAWHDLQFPYILPGWLGAPSPVNDPQLHRPYTWGQIGGSFVDCVLVAIVTTGTYMAAWRAAGGAGSTVHAPTSPAPSSFEAA